MPELVEKRAARRGREAGETEPGDTAQLDRRVDRVHSELAARFERLDAVFAPDEGDLDGAFGADADADAE